MRHSLCAIALATFALATIALGATPACTTHLCTSVYVPSQVTIERTVTARFDPAKSIHAEICKNDDCQSGDFVIAAATATNSRLCGTDRSLSLETGCTFVRTTDGAYAFAARWLDKDSPFKEGDRYRATLTSSDGPLLSIDTKATYSESEPNGEGCGTVKTAAL
jgi:hypothetical protein